MDPAIIGALIVAALVFLYLRVFSPRPEFPPLATDPDDPLMREARTRAKVTIPEIQTLQEQFPQSVVVKLRFVSSSGDVEYLWAEVRGRKSKYEYDVLLVTPPVTHSGHLDRQYVCAVDDIEDWQVRDTQDRIHGGFTQRAMFQIARREGVKLPRKLREAERLYSGDVLDLRIAAKAAISALRSRRMLDETARRPGCSLEACRTITAPGRETGTG
jgi:uncharacterized protein YegJ (DUF2314 family)